MYGGYLVITKPIWSNITKTVNHRLRGQSVDWWRDDTPSLHDEEEDNGPISVSDQAKVSLDMWSWGHGCILLKQIFIFLFSVQTNIVFIYQNPWFD